ncbi:MAG: hypothetical protein CR972_05120 [Candidatus Moraniibacteriota bacterium]|nr:MAG: hypothetical protein CR972_05120 [Candidatus Moranbacteria bacterium]
MQVVPQYIDVEDRIAGPLTWKHIGWLFACGGILFIFWTLFDRITFYIFAAITIPLFAALAFAKPGGVSMVEYIGYGFSFFLRPRVYTWQREASVQQKQKPQQDVKIESKSKKETLTSEEVAIIAQTLDSRGKERNERLQQILKERVNKNNQ